MKITPKITALRAQTFTETAKLAFLLNLDINQFYKKKLTESFTSKEIDAMEVYLYEKYKHQKEVKK